MADEVYQENVYQDERPFISARKVCICVCVCVCVCVCAGCSASQQAEVRHAHEARSHACAHRLPPTCTHAHTHTRTRQLVRAGADGDGRALQERRGAALVPHRVQGHRRRVRPARRVRARGGLGGWVGSAVRVRVHNVVQGVLAPSRHCHSFPAMSTPPPPAPHSCCAAATSR